MWSVINQLYLNKGRRGERRVREGGKERGLEKERECEWLKLRKRMSRELNVKLLHIVSIVSKMECICFRKLQKFCILWIPCWVSSLRIWCCHCFGSSCYCGTGLILGLGTSTCCRWDKKKKKKKTQKTPNIYTYTHTYVYTYIHIHTHICIYVQNVKYMQNTCIYIHTYTHTHMYRRVKKTVVFNITMHYRLEVVIFYLPL